MPLTPVQPASITRFYAVGITQILFCLTISDPAVPTFAELNAGTELTRDWADWSGWAVKTEFIDMPGLQDRFVSQLPGRITAEASSITFYEDKLAADLRDLMPRDTHGYILIADGGFASARADVYEVQVAAVTHLRSADEAAKIKFDYAILSEPSENVDLPQV
jgi:hypothetical protein